MDHKKLWKTLKEMETSDHLTCLLRNLYIGQEATVRTLYRITDWFRIEIGCSLSLCLFNFYAEHIMRNARLDELQAGIKTARRNINNLRYADDDTTLMIKAKKTKELLDRVKGEREKAGLKLSIQPQVHMCPPILNPLSCG